MKPLMSRKVTRDTVVNEWTPAEHHLTHDGQVEFMARMQARIKAAQAKPVENVRVMKRDRKA